MPLSKTDLTPNVDVTHLRSSQGNRDTAQGQEQQIPLNLAVRWTESTAYLESSEGNRLASTKDSSVGKALERIAQGFNLAIAYKAERVQLREQNKELVAFVQYAADQDPNGLTSVGNKARDLLAKVKS